MQDTVALVVLAAISLVLYFLPSMLAFHTRHKKVGWILLLNLLAGWTILGWGLAFVWGEQICRRRAEVMARKHAARETFRGRYKTSIRPEDRQEKLPIHIPAPR
jgi:hypothetical protein